MTSHKSDDTTPIWSPDGRKIAFVSQRRDAEGDIWILEVKKKKTISPKGKPRQLTDYLGFDDHPCFSPDGKRLAFTSDRDGQKNIWICDLKTGRAWQLTTKGGINPHWSPDGQWIAFTSFRKDRGGDLFIIKTTTPENEDNRAIPITSGPYLDGFPRWSPDGKRIVFTRFALDTNRDGKLSPEDNPSIWILTGSGEIQLTTDEFYDYLPFWGRDDKIYFASDRSRNFDIWSIPSAGSIPHKENARAQFRYARDHHPLTGNPFQRIMAFTRVRDFFPQDSLWVAWAEYEMGRTYKKLGYPDLALKSFEKILQNYPEQREVAAQAEIEMAESQEGRAEWKKLIAEYQRIIDKYPDQRAACARAEVLVADLYWENGQKAEALGRYLKVIEDYPDIPSYAAEAQVKLGDVYTAFGDQDEVIKAYLKVIDDYPDEKHWVEVAIRRILESAKSIPDYQRIIQAYGRDYPPLGARAQLQIGLILKERGDFESALKELARVKTQYPDQRAVAAQADMEMADIYLKTGEDLKAINIYRKMIRDYEDLKYSEQARELLISTLLRTADRLKNSHDYALALRRYKAARDVDHRRVEAHRGIVECYYRTGRIDEAIREYKALVKKNPEDEIALYTLGLAYSYKGSQDEGLLKRSNSLIQEALSKNYRLIYAYLTLSYNYEALEELEAEKKRGVLRRAGEALSQPLTWLFHTLTFRKREPPKHWYEKAIDALTTAVALNDEKANPQLESLLCLNLANNYYKMGEFGFEKAYEYYRKKLEYDSTFTSRLQEAVFYQRLGHCGLVVEDFKSSPNYLKRAIRLFQELGKRDQVIVNLERLGLLYQLAGDYEESIRCYRKAAALEERRGNFEGAERAYRNIAYNYQLLGDEDEVLRYCQKALTYLEKAGPKRTKPERNYIRLEVLGLSLPIWNMGEISVGKSAATKGFTPAEEKALLYTLIAESFYRKKEFLQAIHYFEKKLKIYQQRKDPLAQAIFLNNIGYFYAHLHDYQKAWDFFCRSLKICRDKKLYVGIITNIINLGEVSLACLGEPTVHFDEALNYLNMGLRYYQEKDFGFQRGKVRILTILGDLHYYRFLKEAPPADTSLTGSLREQFQRIEDFSRIYQYYQEALNLAEEREQVVLTRNIGELLGSFGFYQEAYDRLVQARNLALKTGSFELLWRIDHSLGNLLLKMDEQTRARINPEKSVEQWYTEAVQLLEDIPTRREGIELRVSERKERDALYEDIISYFSQTGQHERALEYLERAKAKRFLDLTATRKIDLKKERHKLLFGNAKFLQAEIRSLKNRIKRAQFEGRAVMEKWRRRLSSLEEEYSRLLKRIGLKDPELLSLLRVTTVPYQKVQSILKDNQVVLEYFLGRRETLLWIIDRSRFEMRRVPVRRSELRKKVASFIKSLREGKTEGSEELYDLLLKPAQNMLREKTQVIFIPDDCLFYLPFSALRNGGSYLIDRCSIVVVPSLTSYEFCYRKRTLSGVKTLLTGNYRDRQELALVSQYVREPTVLVGQKATEGAIKERAPEADYIHWEQDLIYDKRDPLNSAVRFRSDPQNDGLLRVYEIFGLDLKAGLLTLGSNQLDYTGRERGEEVVALERAFIYAGTPSLLISLWESDEKVQGEFFHHFYANLHRSTKADALAQAQRILKRKYRDPRLWAGFQLVGFGGMTEDEERNFAEKRFLATVLMAREFEKAGEWKDAIGYYEKALTMAEKLNDQESIPHLYRAILNAGINGELFPKAIQYQIKLNQLAEEKADWKELALGYNNLFYFYNLMGNREKAVQYKKKYLALAKREGLEVTEAESYREIGIVYEQGGNYQKSLEFYRKALTAYEDSGDERGKAIALMDLGRVYLTKLDDYTRSLEYHKRALKLLEKIGDKENLVTALQNIGLSYEKLASYTHALRFQRKAEKLSRQLGDPRKRGLSYQYLANLYWKTGDYQKAFMFQRKALKVFRDLGDEKLQLVGLSTLGLLYMSVGEKEKALDYENQALDLAIKIEDKLDQATILKNIGLIYNQASEVEIALQNFKKAAELDGEIGSKRGLAYDFRNIGNALRSLGRYEEAELSLHRALALSREIRDGRSQATCLYELGLLWWMKGDPDSALIYLEEAGRLAQVLSIPDVQWRVYRKKGEILKDRGDLDGALENYEKAAQVIEGMRSKIKVEEYKAGFIDDKMDLYQEVVSLLLKMGRPREAFDFVERAKSRNFVDLLGNHPIDFKGRASRELLAQGLRIQDEMSQVQSRISVLIQKGEDLTALEMEELDSLKTRLEVLRSRYADYLVSLKEQNPELASMVSVDPWGLERIQRILPDSTALVEYYLTQKKTYLWLVRNRSLRVEEIDKGREELVEEVRAFREAIAKGLSVKEESKTLYDELIQPLAKGLRGIKHLIIVPHGVLHYLPFSALMDKKGHYLLEDFTLSLAPSATVLGFCLEKGDRFRRKLQRVLALGNPDLGERALDLPFAEREVKSLRWFFPQVKGLLRGEATETAVKREAGGYDLILFSTHGEYDPTNPLFSALRLTPDSENDGRLEVHEVFGLDLNAYLVTMSACETGLGRITRGDEVIGLSRSFIYAGTPSVVATLWKVDDLAAAVVVKRFHRYLREGYSRAEALRKAQLLVKEEINSHPAYWAAFTLTGDFR